MNCLSTCAYSMCYVYYATIDSLFARFMSLAYSYVAFCDKDPVYTCTNRSI